MTRILQINFYITPFFFNSFVNSDSSFSFFTSTSTFILSFENANINAIIQPIKDHQTNMFNNITNVVLSVLSLQHTINVGRKYITIPIATTINIYSIIHF
jgi:hypothetical protein